MKTLQERLREACVGQPAEIAWPHRILHEAATMLDEWQRIADVRLELCNDAIKQRYDLEAEVARLREALKKDPNTMMIAYESGDHMRLVRAVSARDETLKKIVTLAADHLPELLEAYSSAPVSHLQAGEDVEIIPVKFGGYNKGSGGGGS